MGTRRRPMPTRQTTRMTDAIPPQGDLGPIGDGDYVVVDGDCAESIAARSGLLWTTIWDHPQNAELKKARDIQNLLLPGDRIHVPDKELKHVARRTAKRHTILRKGLHCKLLLGIVWCGAPRRDTPYILVIDGVLHDGTTD